MRSLTLLIGLALSASTLHAKEYAELSEAPHHYWDTHPKDRFTQFLDRWEKNEIQLNHTSELAFLRDLLKALDIPESSQLLIFSATSMQAGDIHAKNPRGIYFNEDTSVGYVPGGKIEILSIDPELGAIFYVFNFPKSPQAPRVDRSTRCMNCHSGERMNFVPGHALESTIPSLTGGTLEAFRRGKFGHTIPLSDRFGGWHVTGIGKPFPHHGNVIGKLSPQGLQRTVYQPGELFKWDIYPVTSSDLLAHMLHEHQAGFINLMVEGIYKARYYQHKFANQWPDDASEELNNWALKMTSYLLFANEADLPNQAIQADENFIQAFRQKRQPLPNGASLRDFDLQQRMMKYRCSYMIETELWKEMPKPLRDRLQITLQHALSLKQIPDEYRYLESAEKQIIRSVLQQQHGFHFTH